MECDGNSLYCYQTFIAGVLASIVGAVSVCAVLRQLRQKSIDQKKFRSKFEAELLILSHNIDSIVSFFEEHNKNKGKLGWLLSTDALHCLEIFSEKKGFSDSLPYLNCLSVDEVRVLTHLEFLLHKHNQYVQGIHKLALARPDFEEFNFSENTITTTIKITEAALTLRNSILRKDNAQRDLNEYLVKNNITTKL